MINVVPVARPSLKSKKRRAGAGLFLALVYIAFVAVHNLPGFSSARLHQGSQHHRYR